MEIIKKYFPELTAEQVQQFSRLNDLYRFWNSQINVISRKDINHLYEHHVLHSLGIARIIRFKPGTQVMDIGTGGGFPGIPLAIMFPSVQFYLVDSIRKKIKVVNEISRELGLLNVTTQAVRAEEIQFKFDFVVSRAVTRLKSFYELVKGRIKKAAFNDIPNGILYLKGGDMEEEIRELKIPVKKYPLSEHFSEKFFESKYVLHLPANQEMIR